MIFLNSRYANGPLAQVINPNSGKYTAAVYRRFPGIQAFAYYTYTWKEGDQIDSFAHAIYGSSSVWWRLMDANPEILDPFLIPPGTVIRVPRG